MVYEAGNVEEVQALLRRTRLALLLVYDSGAPQGRYLAGLIDDIAWWLEPVFAVVRLDVSRAPGALQQFGESHPRLILFLEGRRVWEQIGFFYNSSSDRAAIRRGLLNALRRAGLRPSALGVRLGF